MGQFVEPYLFVPWPPATGRRHPHDRCASQRASCPRPDHCRCEEHGVYEYLNPAVTPFEAYRDLVYLDFTDRRSTQEKRERQHREQGELNLHAATIAQRTDAIQPRGRTMAAPKKAETLNLAELVVILRGAAPPLVDGHPMTIGDLLMQVIPMLQAGDNHMRVWNLGLEMDHAIGQGEGTFALSRLDFEMLKKAVLSGSHPVWVKANLERAFDH